LLFVKHDADQSKNLQTAGRRNLGMSIDYPHVNYCGDYIVQPPKQATQESTLYNASCVHRDPLSPQPHILSAVLEQDREAFGAAV
jgi:hypothetical protein